MSQSHHNAPRLTIMPNSSHRSVTLNIPSTRIQIEEYRDIVQEPPSDPFLDGTLEDPTIDVPVKKYSPLPDITQSDFRPPNYPLIRTECSLIPTKPRSTYKTNMVYHFATTQRTHLPALNKSLANFTTVNAMDLDEDLPECHMNSNPRIATYTSPGERIQSPLERPAAPSPPASAQVKKSNTAAFGDYEDHEGHFSDTEYSNSHFRQESSIDPSNYRRNRLMIDTRYDDYDDED